MTFGEKVKELRTLHGMSQEALAKAIGKSRRTVIGYETGTVYPRLRETYVKLAQVLDTNVDYLRTENEEFMEEVSSKYGRRGVVQAHDILEQTQQLFAGGTLSDDDEIAFIQEIQRLYLDSKERAKKYTPKKYLKVDDNNK